MSDGADLVGNNQEQAVAAWANHLNQLRLDDLLTALGQQDMNLRDALDSLDEAISTIGIKVVATNRGGVTGMHGFIAEVADVGVGNARSQILGEGSIYEWVNDNGPADLMRAGVAIQEKFVASGGRLGLGAIEQHARKYPDFVAKGGKYRIPSDHFEIIQKLRAMSPKEAGTLLTRSGDGPSLKDWERVHTFFEDSAVTFESLERSHLEYSEVQRGAYSSTLQAEKHALRSTDQSRRDDAFHASQPKLRQGLKVTLAAAAVEGGTAFVLAVVDKRREGTRLQDLTSDDWLDIAGGSGFGAVQGGIRGMSLYSLTNFTATPAAVASSIVTAAFGIAEQANRLRRGEIGELEFIENAEIISLEAAVSALSSCIGQALIPVPILGAVIGNTVGTVMYQAVSSCLSEQEKTLIERFLAEQRALDERLAAEYQELIESLEARMTTYLEVLEQAFSPAPETALLGSVALARSLGVAGADILDSEEKALAYFVD